MGGSHIHQKTETETIEDAGGVATVAGSGAATVGLESPAATSVDTAGTAIIFPCAAIGRGTIITAVAPILP